MFVLWEVCSISLSNDDGQGSIIAVGKFDESCYNIIHNLNNVPWD